MKKFPASRRITANPLSAQDVERIVGELADLDLRITKSQTVIAAYQRALEDEIGRVRTAWQRDMEPDCAQRETLQVERQIKLAALQAWAEANKAAEFANPRRRIYLRGIIGFRQSKPALATLPKSTWKSAVSAILASLPRLRGYLKCVYSVDKESILRDRETLSETLLMQAGLRIEQNDEFYFEPKPETSDRLAA